MLHQLNNAVFGSERNKTNRQNEKQAPKMQQQVCTTTQVEKVEAPSCATRNKSKLAQKPK